MRHEEATRHVLKEEGGRAVWVLRVPGQSPLTFKSWVLSPWFAFKCMIGIAQPWRHARGARRLRHAGIQTPVIKSIRPGWKWRRPVLLLEMPYVEGATALDRLRSDDGQLARRLAARLGEFVWMLSEAGLRHRDFKLSNVVVEQGSDAPWLIDPVGVVRHRDRASAISSMLDRLDVEIREGHAGHVNGAASLRRIAIRSALKSSSVAVRKAVLKKLRTHHQP